MNPGGGQSVGRPFQSFLGFEHRQLFQGREVCGLKSKLQPRTLLYGAGPQLLENGGLGDGNGRNSQVFFRIQKRHHTIPCGELFDG